MRPRGWLYDVMTAAGLWRHLAKAQTWNRLDCMILICEYRF